MHAHQQARAVRDGGAVIVDAGAIGGADFAQRGAGAGHDVGDAEPVADFDQFTARDDGLAAGGEFVEGEEHGGGIVIDGDSGSAQQAIEQRRDVDVALAAPAGREVKLRAAQLPPPWAEVLPKVPPRCRAKAGEITSLMERLGRDLPEFRRKQSLAYPIAGMLALIALAVF